MTTGAKPRSVVRDLLTVMSGTAGAQAIGLLILPVLARAFAPQAFGVFQLYLSLLIFCTIAIALRIELTLLSKPDDTAHETTATLFGLVLVVSMVLTLALSGYHLFRPGLGFPPVLLGLGLVGNGFSQVASYKLIRDQDFPRLATLKVSQVLGYAAAALIITAIHPSVWGLIVADVVGRLFAAALALRAVGRGGPIVMHARRLRRLAPFVRQHWELVLVSLPSALVNSAGLMLTPFMIFHVFGAAAAGQYGLVDRSIGVPVAMVVMAGSQVFSGRANALIRAGQSPALRRLLLRVVGGTALVCGLGAAVAYPLLPVAFGFVFGPSWEPAIGLAQVLIFSYATMMVSGIVNQTLVSLGAFRMQAGWDVSWLLLIGAVWIAVVVRGLDLHQAITLHALAVIVLGTTFVMLCLLKLRAAAMPLASEA